MNLSNCKTSSILLLLLISLTCSCTATNDGLLKTHRKYIIMVQAPKGMDISVHEKAKAWHMSLLSEVCKGDAASQLIYSYNQVANGFSARLTEQEVAAMRKCSWFVRAIPAEEPLKLMTTHTPDFLQLRGSNGLWQKTKNMGEGMIIGVLDTGISPGHPSLDGKGMPPPPAKWKGHCDFNHSVCNNKLIGAKSFLKAGGDELKHLPPFDLEDHGTHTASTAAGAYVSDISILGNAMGEAAGVAPRAHLAVYRVCSQAGCESPDIFKGIEEAVNDGCDVLSLSLGGSSQPFFLDPVALGGFYAILKGVFVSTAGGNSGPDPSTLANEAPWLLTVAASSTDRQIRSTVKLGSGLEFNGESLYQPKNWTAKMLPVVYPGAGGNANVSKCVNGTLDSKVVSGKIVLCERGVIGRLEKGGVVLEAGGTGMILVNEESDANSINADSHVLPASHVSYADGVKIKNYIRSTKEPVATFIFKGVAYNAPSSPSVASFSSRGPNLASPLILKPDITGPGVSILAAVPPVSLGEKNTQFFNFMSGTSMATPHLSGIAALIKKAHPNWTPAAIKSALMTTAGSNDNDGKLIMDQTLRPADVFAIGAGQVDPNKALDPGLVYDIIPDEYIRYLCGLRYNDEDINNIIHPAPAVKCATLKAITEEQLNYPSIALSLSEKGSKIISRTVTNVGAAQDTYKAEIKAPEGASMKVEPSTLAFKSLNEKITFKIIFDRSGKAPSAPRGELKWVSAKHVVRSPVALKFE